jgi:hypothetical protein
MQTHLERPRGAVLVLALARAHFFTNCTFDGIEQQIHGDSVHALFHIPTAKKHGQWPKQPFQPIQIMYSLFHFGVRAVKRMNQLHFETDLLCSVSRSQQRRILYFYLYPRSKW